MRRSVLADTGPLYAALDRDDAYHHRARREIKQFAQEKRNVVVASPTLLEAHRLVLRRLGQELASAWLDEVLKTGSLINPSLEDYWEGVMRLSALPDQSITLFDATLAALASRLGMEIWTYDHHFDVMRARVWRA
jgi:predicted nucleic acid-binding protein